MNKYTREDIQNLINGLIKVNVTKKYYCKEVGTWVVEVKHIEKLTRQLQLSIKFIYGDRKEIKEGLDEV